MKSRVVAVLLLVALLATACDGIGRGIPLGKGGGGEPGVEGTSIDVSGAGTAAPDEVCVHRPHLFFVAIGDVGPFDAPTLEIDGATRLTPGTIIDPKYLDQASIEVAGEIIEAIGVFHTDGDAMAIVQLLRANGIDAAPVHAWALTGHWGFAPDTDPLGSTIEVNPPADPRRGHQVAVLDTGMVVDGGYPKWIADHVTFHDARFDLEEPGLPTHLRGHGMFIASLLRQQWSELAVTMFRIPGSPAKVMVGAEGEVELSDGTGMIHGRTTFVSDELQALATILRAAQSKIDFAGLNLSGGTYLCDSLADTGATTLGLRAAITALKSGQPDAVIAASAGNDNISAIDFLPSAFPDVHGVASTDRHGKLSSFSNPGNIVAPGEGLIGFGPSGAKAAKWSGTSFATPVWLAAHLESGRVLGDLSVKKLRVPIE